MSRLGTKLLIFVFLTAIMLFFQNCLDQENDDLFGTDTPPAVIDPVVTADVNDTTIEVSARVSSIREATPDENFSRRPRYLLGHLNSNSLRVLLQFDTADIPDGSQIVSAQLQITLLSAAGELQETTAEVLQLSEEFSFDDVTWNQRTITDQWALPGGDFTTSSVGQFALKTAFDSVSAIETIDVDVQSAVDAWVTDPTTNKGLALSLPNSTETVWTLEASGNLSPKLTITFR